MLGEIQVASIHAVLERPSGPLHLLATHPLPPGGADYAAWRNEQLANVAHFIGAVEGEAVVIGDLNTTPWSPYFKQLCRDADLRDSAKGFGLQVSWPTFCWPLGIPIDHCLVSPAIGVVDRRTGPNIGSDHSPLIVELTGAD